MSELKSLMKMVLFVAIVYGGYNYYTKHVAGGGSAKISGMTPSGMTSDARCWVDLEFKAPPQGINLLDVKVVFSGPLLVRGSVEYGWGFIGANAQRPRKAGTGWEKAMDISPYAAPPLNTSFSVNFPVPVKNETLSDADFLVTATLYWGGIKQSSRDGSFRYQYHAK